MAKYIDAEKLIAEIDRLYAEHSSKYENDDACQVLDHLEDFIGSLQQELVEVKVKPLMGYHKSCGFVATEIELQGYGVICENGEGKIYTEK